MVAPSIVATTTDNDGNIPTTESFSHTLGASANLLLVTIHMIHDDPSDVETITAVSYNSVAMTEEVTLRETATRAIRTAIYSLLDPATGSNTVSFTVSNTGTHQDAVCAWIAAATDYINADSSTPVEASATFGEQDNNMSISITTTNANALVVGAFNTEGGDMAPFTPVTGTERYDVATGAAAFNDTAGTQLDIAVASPGAQAIASDAAVNDDYVSCIVELNEIQAAAARLLLINPPGLDGGVGMGLSI